ncbi:MAG TPA: FcoT family thioesterase [Actinophytocola sp.]|uniref:FcoT family thioesterase n=1 Tax=Actinophytocola sp. TaxID=1872138 RepID=UPI002DB9983C|nr:FcoT family thioesterase [Actinophytocola sp.]HEU5471213.1 FcoT family thioesterase [Actinophytocola sp.]
MTGSILRLTDTAARSQVDDDRQLLAKVLRPYRDPYHYLTWATVTTRNGMAVGRGEFRIQERSTVDTGMLGGAEFGICYEQLVRFLIASSIKERSVPELEGWATGDYWAGQVPDLHVVRLNSAFRSPVDSSAFFGEVALASFTESTVRRPILLIDTTCRFWDGESGRADGEVLLALLDPPDPRSARAAA